MLRGYSSISLDEKGRIAIPARYRESLQALCKRQMIITLAVDEKGVGQADLLWLFPLSEWEVVEQKISNLPAFNPMALKLKRYFIGNAAECEMDTQGRLLIPEKLRKLAKLDKKLVLIGVGNKFEIWREDVYSAGEQAFMAGSDSEGLDELGDLSF